VPGNGSGKAISTLLAKIPIVNLQHMSQVICSLEYDSALVYPVRVIAEVFNRKDKLSAVFSVCLNWTL